MLDLLLAECIPLEWCDFLLGEEANNLFLISSLALSVYSRGAFTKFSLLGEGVDCTLLTDCGKL